MNSQKTPRIQFAYYAYLTSPMGDVFQYLLRNASHSTNKGKRMGLAAMSAFWKPFSARATLNLDEQEVKAIALTSISELQQQISLIRKTFNIPETLNEMTRRDVENMIEESLTQRIARRERATKIVPLSNNRHTYR